MAKKKRRVRREKKYEFRPDPSGTKLLKKLHLTKLQQTILLKWTLYALLCLVGLIAQDVIMSRFRFSGATTDLAVCLILLIGIFEGMENGGLFALIASTIYWFSGSAPGPYVIAFLTILTVGISWFRQSYWLRGFSSTALWTSLAILAYEMLVFVFGLFQGLTILDRAGVFLLTGVMTCVVMLPLYPLVKSIAKIGGDTWKE